jgi:hypothetical protein
MHLPVTLDWLDSVPGQMLQAGASLQLLLEIARNAHLGLWLCQANAVGASAPLALALVPGPD